MYILAGSSLILGAVTLLYFFGIITFTHPGKLLQSSAEPDRMDGLILVAEMGTNGSNWQSQILQILKTDPSPNVREMAVITLREMGSSPQAIEALHTLQQTEANASVQSAIKEILDQWNQSDTSTY